MRKRPFAGVTCLLVALILSVMPCILWLDFVSPRSQDSSSRRLRAEEILFRMLVVPPGYVANLLFGRPTEYSLQYVLPGSSSEAAASLPPSTLALDHIRVALPMWFITCLCGYGLSAFASRRLTLERHVA